MRDLSGKVKVNGKDLWSVYHAFLREEKKGGRENLNAILSPAKVKGNIPVNLREEDGERYSADLGQRSEGRDVTLHFAIYADNAGTFITRYKTFITFLKEGWLTFEFPTLGDSLRMRMFYKECPTGFSALSDLWNAGEQCGAFKVTFREPEPSF